MRLVRGVSVGVAIVLALAVPLLAAPPARAAGAFRFTDAGLQASEGQAMVRVAVQRGDLPVSRTSVAYRTEAGTASPGSDYTEAAGTLTFGVGETSAFFTVFLRDDAVAESAETVMLLLDDDARSEIRLRIEDDDLATTSMASDRGSNAIPAAAASAPTPAGEAGAAAQAPTVRLPAPLAAAPRRPTTVVRRAPAAAAPRRIDLGQSRVTPFELRPAPRSALGPVTPTDVDAGIALLAAFLLARVAAEVWFRSRGLAS